MVAEKEEIEMSLKVPTTFSWQKEKGGNKSKKNVRKEDVDRIERLNNSDEEDNIFDGSLKHNPSIANRRKSRRESRPSIGRQNSRYADRRRGEDEAAHLGFVRHLQRREGHLRSRRELLEGGEEESRVGAEEAFDFFCKDWRVEDKREEDGGEGEDSPEVEGSDKRKLLTSDILGGGFD